MKSLRLVGFKSFADRTRLEFEPGVTVIVGPNGSGKSNLVDAVAWVMGTQSTRSLRTQKMEDVIFAGTATRPALGRAEVTLLFDNEDRGMPLDLDEISVTRRLYRDGSSEYRINGVECRLLDIQELLSDSGIGRQQHLIVGQGRIDDLLNAKPEDHRAVIEEAAGILKHRLRKDRSLRRLERTDGDVLRLRDILRELKRQMRPLKRQAESADRHDRLVGEIRSLRLYLGGEAMRAATGRRDALTGEHDDWVRKLEEARREFAGLETGIPKLAEDAGEAGKALDRDTAAAARHETTLERLRRIAQVAAERRRSSERRLEDAGRRRRDLESEANELETEMAGSAAIAAQARRDFERADAVVRELDDEARSLVDQEELPVEGALAVVRGDLRALESAIERDAREERDLTRRLGVLAARVAEETAEIGRLQEAIRAADGETGPLQRAYETARGERKRLQAAWEETERRAEAARIRVAAAGARLEAIEQAVTFAGDPAARDAAAGLPQIVGTIAALLDVPEAAGAAVDAALGPWAAALVAGTRDGVSDAVSTLKASGLGGVDVVVAAGDGGTDPEPIREIAEAWGLEPLTDLLGPNADRTLAHRLIGDVIMTEGWGAAWDLATRYPGVRAVTPEGDIVDRYGIRIARPDGASPAMVEAAAAALEDAERELARAESLVVTTRRDFEGARTAERVALEALEATELRISGMAEALAMQERSRAAGEEELERLETRRSAVMETAGERESRIERLRERLGALEGEEAERQRAWQALAARRTEVEEQRSLADARRQEASAKLGAVLERRKMVEARLSTVRGELQRLTAVRSDPRQAVRLATIEEQAREAIAVVSAHVTALRERQRGLRREAGAAGARLSEARTRLEEVRRAADVARERMGRIEVELAQLDVRIESIAEGLRRDVDATVEEALAAERPDVEAEDLEEALATGEAELRRLGPVNPLAAQEYQELRERFEFLSGQLEDLERSRSELRKVISSLDAQILEEFTAAFDEVSRYYEEYFAVLFPGGKGGLRLLDPDEPLTSGVEVEAKPLGKKVGRLSLLSGGERSLAALAFLFSVFRARPSPFYILDEVEAALDDANLHRFLKLVGRFRDRAQLLIVTHQQQTMHGADVLYGVTLEPGGSSQVVSRRVRERSLS